MRQSAMQHEKRCVQVATDSIRTLAERVSSMNTEDKPNMARLCDEAVTSIPAARLEHEIPVFHWSSTRSWQRRKVATNCAISARVKTPPRCSSPFPGGVYPPTFEGNCRTKPTPSSRFSTQRDNLRASLSAFFRRRAPPLD